MGTALVMPKLFSKMGDKISANILGDAGSSLKQEFGNLIFKTIEIKADDPIWDLRYLKKMSESESDSQHKFIIYGFKMDHDFELVCLVSKEFKIPFYYFPLNEDIITLDISGLDKNTCLKKKFSDSADLNRDFVLVSRLQRQEKSSKHHLYNIESTDQLNHIRLLRVAFPHDEIWVKLTSEILDTLTPKELGKTKKILGQFHLKNHSYPKGQFKNLTW